MDQRDTGSLLNRDDILLNRGYFSEMTELIGFKVVFRAPKPGSRYNGYGEWDTYFEAPVAVGCIFEEHPNQWTMKKLGWDAELDKDKSVIHVAYDVPGLQAGGLFVVPSGIDGSVGRVFRVLRMSTTMMYPASVACELAPEYETTDEKSQLEDFTKTDFNLLDASEEDD